MTRSLQKILHLLTLGIFPITTKLEYSELPDTKKSKHNNRCRNRKRSKEARHNRRRNRS